MWQTDGGGHWENAAPYGGATAATAMQSVVTSQDSTGGFRFWTNISGLILFNKEPICGASKTNFYINYQCTWEEVFAVWRNGMEYLFIVWNLFAKGI